MTEEQRVRELIASRKLRCRECHWKGAATDALIAPNPFDAECALIGCPKCKEACCLEFACDDPDCWELASCGWPSPTGYRSTCGKHYNYASP